MGLLFFHWQLSNILSAQLNQGLFIFNIFSGKKQLLLFLNFQDTAFVLTLTVILIEYQSTQHKKIHQISWN